MATITSTETFATKLSDHFRLSGSLTYEDFQHWMNNEYSEISPIVNSSNTSIPITEIITILEDIKPRTTLSDQISLDWCIQKLFSSLPNLYDSETIPIRKSLLKVALDHIEDHSPLGNFRLSENDEKISIETLQTKNLKNCNVQNLSPEILAPTFDINDFNLSIFSLAEEMISPILLTTFAFKAFMHWDIFKVLSIDNFQKYLREVWKVVFSLK